MLAREFKSAVKTIIGSCVSLGVLVENKTAVEIEGDVDKGIFDKEIQEQKTETPADKKLKLKKYFDSLHKKQEAAIKVEEEEAKAKEEAKTKEAGAKGAGAKEGEALEEGADDKEGEALEEGAGAKPEVEKK